MKIKRIIVSALALMLCLIQLCSCGSNGSVRIIDNVSENKIKKNPHVEKWINEDTRDAFDGINNHVLEYKVNYEGRYLYKVVVLRTNVEKKANVEVELVETEKDITVKIIFTDKAGVAKDGRTVSYIEFKAPLNKTVYYDVVCEGESRELLQKTDKNIAM